VHGPGRLQYGPHRSLPLSVSLCERVRARSYCGHSDGHHYLPGERVERLSRCAVSLLVGCSSGRLRDQGILDPDGYLLAYLCSGRCVCADIVGVRVRVHVRANQGVGGCGGGGSPAVLANLWDVTDKDIDRLTAALLTSWGLVAAGAFPATVAPHHPLPPVPPRATLAEALVAARHACRMPYLVGAAPVVYGVPVRLAPST
jgi:separase